MKRPTRWPSSLWADRESAGLLPWFCLVSLAALILVTALSWQNGGNIEIFDAGLLLAMRRAAKIDGPIATGVRDLMLSVTSLGALATLAMVMIGVAGFLVSLNRRATALRLLTQAGAGFAVAALLKHLVGRPRPTVVAHWADVTSSSFPSGHSADSAIAYFLLAALVTDVAGKSRMAVYAERLAAALVLMIGVSRVYLGVRFPTDVLAGWTFGAAWVWFCRRLFHRPATAPIMRPKTFHDVVVYPTQQLLEPPFLLFRGGPDWPRFWFQRGARHCRFTPAIPLDVRPRRAAMPVVHRQPQGVWCGPVTQHFGHAVTTFGARLAAASLLPPYVPLMFSARPGEEPPPFFWQLLAHFGIPPDRVRIVAAPTIVDTLLVLPQAERLLGGTPDAAYLDLLDQLSGPPPSCDDSRVYVSRAAMWKGKVAGESYLETLLEGCGYRTFRPENFPLDQQLETYRRASRLIFAEGSAIHGLQLLGRTGAEVTVIARRNGVRLAQAALRPRLPSLRYIDAVRGLVHGVGGRGRRQPSAGMTIIDTAILIADLEAGGIPIRSLWDEAEFRRHQSRDLAIWLEARNRHPTHQRDQARIKRSALQLSLRLADFETLFTPGGSTRTFWRSDSLSGADLDERVSIFG